MIYFLLPRYHDHHQHFIQLMEFAQLLAHNQQLVALDEFLDHLFRNAPIGLHDNFLHLHYEGQISHTRWINLLGACQPNWTVGNTCHLLKSYQALICNAKKDLALLVDSVHFGVGIALSPILTNPKYRIDFMYAYTRASLQITARKSMAIYK